MRLSEGQRKVVDDLKSALGKQAERLAELGMETGKREFVSASSHVDGAKLIVITILTEDKDLELNGPRTPEGPQLVPSNVN